MKLAESEMNAAGGIKGKRCSDHQRFASRPTEAVMMLRKLAEDDKVLAIVGPHYSSEAEVNFPAGIRLDRADLHGFLQTRVAKANRRGLSATR